MINQVLIIDYIKNAKTLIWDFDGVIKDSVEIKGEVFKNLFADRDIDLQEKIIKHHNLNGGISRYEKLKIYLNWTSQDSSENNVKKYASKFSELIINKVINSDYIYGVHKYLMTNYKKQDFYLVTATPQEEIITITKKLNIFNCFKEIFGYPNKKVDSFKSILQEITHDQKKLVVIGDSISEYKAAKKHHLKFILRLDKSKNKIPEWYIEKDLILKNF